MIYKDVGFENRRYFPLSINDMIFVKQKKNRKPFFEY